jgi:hypothetical protein
MYGKSLEDALSPKGGIGTPPLPAPDDPMSNLLAGKAKVQPQTDEMKYHQQRMDVLAALKRAIDKGADPKRILIGGPTDYWMGEDKSEHTPQGKEAQLEFNRLFEIYNKLPGGSDNLLTRGADFPKDLIPGQESHETPFAQDAEWAGEDLPTQGFRNSSDRSRYNFGKDSKGRM